MNHHRISIFGLILGFVLCFPAWARADEVALFASRDTTLYEVETTSSNGQGQYFFVGRNGRRAIRRALIAFDVAAALPPGAKVTNATLTLTASRGQDGPTTVDIHRVTRAWGEGTSHASGNEGAGAPATPGDATWTHRVWPSVLWKTPGGDFLPDVSASLEVRELSSYGWTGAALARDVQHFLDQPDDNNGWILIADAADAIAKRFDSRSGAGSGPVLTVTFDRPAAVTGACCLPDGSCGVSLHPGDSCAGKYQGSNTTCGRGRCPEVEGACCAGDASATCGVSSRRDCHGTWQGGSTTCDPNPCPVILTPFVDPLPLPAVATPTEGRAGGAAHYAIQIVQVKQKLHRDLPPTTVWGFDDGTGGGYPGPTIEARTGSPVHVTWINDLRDQSGNFLTTHPLAVDHCVHGAADSDPRTVIHLHGGHVAPASDGNPELTLLPGERAEYDYPNQQRAATIWYHDHALGITRLNVYMGMAGFYLIRDHEEDALHLPRGKYEIPLAIQDRSFNPDGSLRYPEKWQESVFGNNLLVNGKVSPFLNVETGPYRFRMLNGSTSRFYTLSLSNHGAFTQIGNDGGLLPKSFLTSEVTIAPGERADLIIHFNYVGDEVILQNSAPSPFPSGGSGPDLVNVMKFIVTARREPTSPLPINLSHIDALPEAGAARSRDFVIDKGPAEHCGGEMWMINGKTWGDISERPHLGTTEIWRFINRSGVTHPMHIHASFFQVLSRQFFDVKGSRIALKGAPTPPEDQDTGWKDTVEVGPFEAVRVIVPFNDFAGRYPYHCHLLEHEDHGMMRQFEAVPVCGDHAIARGYETCDDGNEVSGDGCSAQCQLESPTQPAGSVQAAPYPPARSCSFSANAGRSSAWWVLVPLCAALGRLRSRKQRRRAPRFSSGRSRRRQRWKAAGAALLVSALLATLTSRARAATTSVTADRDNTLFEDPAGSLSNGAGEYAFVGKTGQGLTRRGLLRFDLSAIPPNATITKATVQLTVSQAPSGIVALTLHRVLAAWGEGTSNSGGTPTSGGGGGALATLNDATWLYRNYASDAWSNPGGDFSAVDSATQNVGGPGVYSWSSATLAQDAQFFLKNSASNYGFLLSGGETASGTAKRFNTRENTNASTRPLLIVEYDIAAMPAPLPRWPTFVLALLLALPLGTLAREHATGAQAAPCSASGKSRA